MPALKLLGHASIIMTEISTHVAIRKVKMVHANTHPRGVRGIIDYGIICDRVAREAGEIILMSKNRWSRQDSPRRKSDSVNLSYALAIDASAFEHDHVPNESPPLAEYAPGKDRFRK